MIEMTLTVLHNDSLHAGIRSVTGIFEDFRADLDRDRGSSEEDVF